ncbi:MAG: class I SAM-dependent methyltransferase [Oligoflexia bacterium]|nr:class I SAM-dependent methyltransferase [Oligoflexia bacterium]
MLPIHKAKTSVFNYEEIPSGYYFDKMLNGGAVQKFWHWEKFSHVAAKIPDGSSVLDLGCGPGSFLYVLSKQKKNINATGADLASTQIEFAKKTVTSSNSNTINFKNVDFNKAYLPFEDSSFDYITCIEVIEHIHPHLALKTLSEAKRLLKPNGKIIVTTPNYRSMWPVIEYALEKLSPVKYHEQHISKFTPNALAKFLEAAGFNLLNINSLFVLAPFLSPLSKNMAKKILSIENSLRFLPGSLLVAEAKCLDL